MRDAEENLVERVARMVWEEVRHVVYTPSVHAPSEVETGRVKQGEGFQQVASRPEVVWSWQVQGWVAAEAHLLLDSGFNLLAATQKQSVGTVIGRWLQS